MQNTNVYKIKSYAVFSGFTNSIIISLCLIMSSNQMCDGRLDGRTDRHVHPSISTLLKATRVFYFFYFPGSLLWPGWFNDLGRWNTSDYSLFQRLLIPIISFLCSVLQVIICLPLSIFFLGRYIVRALFDLWFMNNIFVSSHFSYLSPSLVSVFRYNHLVNKQVARMTTHYRTKHFH